MTAEQEGVAMQVLSFKEMVKALDHLPKTKRATILVHDSLDIARSIAKHLFGDGYDPDLVFRIRELLVREEEGLDDAGATAVSGESEDDGD